MQTFLGKLVSRGCFRDSRNWLWEVVASFIRHFSQSVIDLRLLMFDRILNKLHHSHSTFSDYVSTFYLMRMLRKFSEKLSKQILRRLISVLFKSCYGAKAERIDFVCKFNFVNHQESQILTFLPTKLSLIAKRHSESWSLTAEQDVWGGCLHGMGNVSTFIRGM